MATETPEQIKGKVLKSLETTRFAVSSLESLSGGVGNFLFRARLTTPLEDGTTEVAVKHGEDYIATHPQNELTLDRCKVEVECLNALADFRVSGAQDSVQYVVRTPKCYFYDEKSHTQILEYMPSGIDLKNYVLKNFASPTPEAHRAQFHQLGKQLARWIIGFHEKTGKEARDAQVEGEKSQLYAELEACQWMQNLKHTINYDWLVDRIKTYPDILEEAREVFEDFRNAAKEELKGEVMPIHGDFWTGNIVIGNLPVQKDDEIPVFVIDWEMAQLGVHSLDFGQMLGEMYALWVYRRSETGLWLLEGFCEGLHLKDEKVAFRTAAQLGCHLVAFDSVIPTWGTPEQGKECARVGRDLIVHAWKRDRLWFEQSDLACLFAHLI
ncbi:kinase-like domain-containing protein [Truncatella angustata]|uniref:Kinase-like domain-containing protein n=1 Tax=Truncatella angustata TaxID=152316 RepID=A0A9P8UZX2_9PEZI|nr:kinase-like domain-containing protein [Truncatella angustata]KAH6661238.1 kinase-like domain-containing protein [Truncatella angustata]